MKLFKHVFLLILILGSAGLAFLYAKENLQPPFYKNFSVFFQEIGKPIHSINRSISKVLPIEDIDEKMLGDALVGYLDVLDSKENEQKIKYLNKIVMHLSENCKKEFSYRVFIVQGPPNACAFPGGIICISDELLDLVSSESELISILGHEIGHIECNHLFDACREEMLRRKKSKIAIISFAGEVINSISKLTYNKTQEDEADEFGFRLLLSHNYDPLAFSGIFQKLASKYSEKNYSTFLIDDFFKSHPDLELRISKFKTLAENYLLKHPDFNGYIGMKNNQVHITAFEEKYPDEYANYIK
ncbi:MAG: M48 family metallopeptidase [Candidatus Lokiarchaeota archaeon]|nr:M48 family metallopeptidase [Candidatus Lokiarchaeota archaeon]